MAQQAGEEDSAERDLAEKDPPAEAIDLCSFSAWVRPSHEYATTERD